MLLQKRECEKQSRKGWRIRTAHCDEKKKLFLFLIAPLRIIIGLYIFAELPERTERERELFDFSRFTLYTYNFFLYFQIMAQADDKERRSSK